MNRILWHCGIVWLSAASVGAAVYLSGTINHNLTYTGEHVLIRGDVLIRGSLTLNNCTVYAQMYTNPIPSNRQYRIIVGDSTRSGTFIAQNSTFTSFCDTYRGTVGVYLSAYSSPNTAITGCTFNNIAPDSQYSFQPAYSIKIDNTTQNFAITNNVFRSLYNPSVIIERSIFTLRGNTFSDLTPASSSTCNETTTHPYDIQANLATISLYGTSFSQKNYLYVSNSALLARSCTFGTNTDSGMILRTQDSTIDLRQNVSPALVSNPWSQSLGVRGTASSLIVLPFVPGNQITEPMPDSFYISSTKILQGLEVLKSSFHIAKHCTAPDYAPYWTISGDGYGTTFHGYAETTFAAAGMTSQQIQCQQMRNAECTLVNTHIYNHQPLTVLSSIAGYVPLEIAYPPLGTIGESNMLPTFNAGQIITITGMTGGDYTLDYHKGLIGAGTEDLNISGWTAIATGGSAIGMLGTIAFSQEGVYTLRLSEPTHPEHAVYAYVNIAVTSYTATADITSPASGTVISNTTGYPESIEIYGIADWNGTTGLLQLHYGESNANGKAPKQWTPIPLNVTPNQPSPEVRLLGSLSRSSLQQDKYYLIRLYVTTDGIAREERVLLDVNDLLPADISRSPWWIDPTVPDSNVQVKAYLPTSLNYTLHLTSPTNPTVSVLDAVPRSPGLTQDPWTGLCDSIPCPNGLYYPYIQTDDGAGHIVTINTQSLSNSSEYRIVLDTALPIAEITSPWDAAIISNVLGNYDSDTNLLNIFGRACDPNFAAFTLQYGEVPSPNTIPSTWLSAQSIPSSLPQTCEPQYLGQIAIAPDRTVYPYHVCVQLAVTDMVNRTSTSLIWLTVDMLWATANPNTLDAFAGSATNITSHIPDIGATFSYLYHLVVNNTAFSSYAAQITQGRQLRTIVPATGPILPAPRPSADYVDTWDGLDQTGQPAPDAFVGLNIDIYDGTAFQRTLSYGYVRLGAFASYPSCNSSKYQLHTFKPFDTNDLQIYPYTVPDDAFVAFYMMNALNAFMGTPFDFYPANETISFIWDGIIKEGSLIGGETIYNSDSCNATVGPDSRDPSCTQTYCRILSGSTPCFGAFCVGQYIYFMTYPTVISYPMQSFFLRVHNTTRGRPEISDLSVSPMHFSPLGANITTWKPLSVQFTLSEPATVTVKVFSYSSYPDHEIYSHSISLPQGSNQILWDGSRSIELGQHYIEYDASGKTFIITIQAVDDDSLRSVIHYRAFRYFL